MQIAVGTFDGTGAALNVGIGFIPRMVKLWNVTEGTLHLSYAEWMREFSGLATKAEGISMAFADDTNGDAAIYALGAGIAPYDGGTVGLSTEVYLIRDPNPDKRDKGTLGYIDTYTQYATNTGHVNAGVPTTAPNIVGVGSPIYIDTGDGAKMYYISAMTNDGDATNELTLNKTVRTGTITFLGGRFSYVQCPTTMIMPAGFTLSMTTGAINTDNEMIAFIAYGD